MSRNRPGNINGEKHIMEYIHFFSHTIILPKVILLFYSYILQIFPLCGKFKADNCIHSQKLWDIHTRTSSISPQLSERVHGLLVDEFCLCDPFLVTSVIFTLTFTSSMRKAECDRCGTVLNDTLTCHPWATR